MILSYEFLRMRWEFKWPIFFCLSGQDFHVWVGKGQTNYIFLAANLSTAFIYIYIFFFLFIFSSKYFTITVQTSILYFIADV